MEPHEQRVYEAIKQGLETRVELERVTAYKAWLVQKALRGLSRNGWIKSWRDYHPNGGQPKRWRISS